MTEYEKKNIAVIGEQEFTLGFEIAGIQKSHNPENYRDKIEELLKKEDLGIIIAKQSDIEELPKRVQKEVDQNVDPVVVPLSEKQENLQLKEKIKKAIGADITQ